MPRVGPEVPPLALEIGGLVSQRRPLSTGTVTEYGRAPTINLHEEIPHGLFHDAVVIFDALFEVWPHGAVEIKEVHVVDGRRWPVPGARAGLADAYEAPPFAQPTCTD